MMFLLPQWWIARRQNSLKILRVVGDEVVSITVYMYFAKVYNIAFHSFYFQNSL